MLFFYVGIICAKAAGFLHPIRRGLRFTKTYHNVIMGFKQETYTNHEAINTIIMAVKKIICYKAGLKCCNPNTISNIIEGRIRVEKYLQTKN